MQAGIALAYGDDASLKRSLPVGLRFRAPDSEKAGGLDAGLWMAMPALGHDPDSAARPPAPRSAVDVDLRTCQQCSECDRGAWRDPG